MTALDGGGGKIDADEGRAGQAERGRDEVHAVAAAEFEVAARFGRRGIEAEHPGDRLQMAGVGLRQRGSGVLDGVVGEGLGHGWLWWAWRMIALVP